MLDYKIHKIEFSDIDLILDVYRDGVPNSGHNIDNPNNVRTDMNTYNSFLVNGTTFFCDTNNKKLLDVIEKNLEFEKDVYISNIHYIKYGIGNRAVKHHDLPSSIRTYIFMLADDFKGGEFILENKNIDLKKGDVLEFNGALKHEVKKITEGIREVLVIWTSRNKNLINEKKEKTLF